ncbi:hypothetical protein MXL54_14895 [Enterobacteriaceae bacterium G50]|nr:hypothetical protein [Enterobacteriaceae bacterium G50]
MERKFKSHQHRDGSQIAEESTGARLEDGLDFLVRANKSANWCIAAAHAEALEINAAIDNMIACRQTIADKKPDFMQETWELVRLGNEYKEAGRKWYKWAKSTALKLWEKTAESQ